MRLRSAAVTATALYDPGSPAFGDHMPEVYRRMRDDQPIYHDPRGRYVALSRFADVRAAALDWETFSSAAKLERTFLKPQMAMMDPPRHARMRAVVSKAFTPRRVTDLEPRIRAIATRLLDAITGTGTGRCELMDDYARLLPGMVMAELIGIPDEVNAECRVLTDQNMRKTSPRGAEPAVQRANEIFADLFAQRRRQPADDLLTALLHAEVDGLRLSEDELLGFCWLLLVGGNDTTTNLIGNGTELLARHPDSRRQLVRDMALLPGAIEEMLRVESPTHVSQRATVRDAELPSGPVPAGIRVLLLWGSANLDEREFDDPERFDIHRRPGRHLALGHGPHFCLGAALARLEARVAFEELLGRIPEYELAAPPERLVSSTFRGFERLELSFSVPVP